VPLAEASFIGAPPGPPPPLPLLPGEPSPPVPLSTGRVLPLGLEQPRAASNRKPTDRDAMVVMIGSPSRAG
jgi:hypothetical protein